MTTLTTLMTAKEARACLEEMREHASSMHDLILRFDEGQGWRALKYHSLHECIMVELGRSLSSAYRLRDESEVIAEISRARESATVISGRGLAELKPLPPGARTVVYSAAESSGAVDTGSLREHAQAFQSLPPEEQARVVRENDAAVVAKARKEEAEEDAAKIVDGLKACLDRAVRLAERYDPETSRATKARSAVLEKLRAARAAVDSLPVK